MSGEDREVVTEIRNLLQGNFDHFRTGQVIDALNRLSEKDFCEFTRLMQKWMACR